MAKTKTPFISLGSKGTVGGVLTSQKRGKATLLRSTPIPTDPYSLAQAYQRWDYQDYAYLWTLLSEATKQTYRTRASRFHITGFNLWMRENLKDLTNLVARWHLDERSGATVYDTSRNSNHGTIFGASASPGFIDGAYSFDGINDYINCGHDPSLDITGDISFEVIVSPIAPVPPLKYPAIINKGHPNQYSILLYPNERAQLRLHIEGTDRTYVWLTFLTPPNVRYTLTATRETAGPVKLYLNGQLDRSLAGHPGLIDVTVSDLLIGNYSTYWLNTRLDELRLYDRVLDATEVLRHSERRYPV